MNTTWRRSKLSPTTRGPSLLVARQSALGPLSTCPPSCLCPRGARGSGSAGDPLPTRHPPPRLGPHLPQAFLGPVSQTSWGHSFVPGSPSPCSPPDRTQMLPEPRSPSAGPAVHLQAAGRDIMDTPPVCPNFVPPFPPHCPQSRLTTKAPLDPRARGREAVSEPTPESCSVALSTGTVPTNPPGTRVSRPLSESSLRTKDKTSRQERREASPACGTFVLGRRMLRKALVGGGAGKQRAQWGASGQGGGRPPGEGSCRGLWAEGAARGRAGRCGQRRTAVQG